MSEFIALDFETTGKYPLSAEICELAVIKFNLEGENLGEWSSLVKPRSGMNKTAESIHGLSLEDLKNAPYIEELLEQLLDFVGDCPIVGHNLSFDLGFLAFEMDKLKGQGWLDQFLMNSHFCTSIMSLNTLPQLSSHRLKHLVEYFGLEEAPNHRAHQDALTCKNVFLKLIGKARNMEDLLNLQGQKLLMRSFSTLELCSQRPELKTMVDAVCDKQDFDLMYSKGSRKNTWRKLCPAGLVLKSNKESFLVATDPGETQTKRFMLDKILGSREVLEKDS